MIHDKKCHHSLESSIIHLWRQLRTVHFIKAAQTFQFLPKFWKFLRLPIFSRGHWHQQLCYNYTDANLKFFRNMIIIILLLLYSLYLYCQLYFNTIYITLSSASLCESTDILAVTGLPTFHFIVCPPRWSLNHTNLAFSSCHLKHVCLHALPKYNSWSTPFKMQAKLELNFCKAIFKQPLH